MDSVALFREFKFPHQDEASVDLGFFKATKERNSLFMAKDLAKSGLTPEDICAYTSPLFDLARGSTAGYGIPYWDLKGKPVVRRDRSIAMWRVRQEWPEHVTGAKYTQPSKDALTNDGIPRSLPYILPDVLTMLDDHLVICEGEKKTACAVKHLGLAAIGIGGCWSWGIDKALHPWTKELIATRGVTKVTIVPDGDIKKYKICQAYGALALELTKLGLEVDIIAFHGIEDKLDDLIVEWGVEAQGHWENLPRKKPTDLVETRAQLAIDYGLPVEASKAGDVVQQHASSVLTLMEEHPAFGNLWLNMDTGLVMMGDGPVVSGVTDMEVTAHFQKYFQFNRVTDPMVSKCMVAVSKKNKKSPFREWVREQRWDGVERLADVFIDLWGCPDNDITREITLKFWVAMVARMESPGCKHDWMLVTVGTQGIGKTWVAEIMTHGLHVPMIGTGTDKDTLQLMGQGLIVVVDELSSYNTKDMNTWKSIITNTRDTYRAPYERSPADHPRRSVLYGTSNTREFLKKDITGQRRYGVLEPAHMLDVPAFKEMLPQLWAEACTVYDLGDCDHYELSRKVQAYVAQEFQGADPLAETIERWLASWGFDDFIISELLEGIGKSPSQAQNRNTTGPIADILANLGCNKKKARLHGDKHANTRTVYIIDRERVPKGSVGAGGPLQSDRY